MSVDVAATMRPKNVADELEQLEVLVKRVHAIEGMLEAVYENIHGPRPPAPSPATPTGFNETLKQERIYIYERLQGANSDLRDTLDRVAHQAEELLAFTDLRGPR